MNAYKNHIETEDGLVVFLTSGRHQHVLRDNPLFPEVKDLIDARKVNEIPDLIDIAGKIRKYSGGRFWVDDFGVVVLDGASIPENLSKRLLSFVDDELPTLPLELFWNRLRENPSEDSRRDLWDFLDHNDIPLTKDGKFLAYKRVKRLEGAEGKQLLVSRVDAETGEDMMVLIEAQEGDLMDINSSTIRNNPGDEPFMPRDDVDPDRNNTCSRGLHVAAYAYADKKYYSNGDLLEVLVDPRDVVAVPTDYNGEKMRVSKYKVSRIAGLPRTEPLAFTVGSEVEYTDPDTGETEEATVTNAHDGHPNRYDLRAKRDGSVIPGAAQNDLKWPKGDVYDEDWDEDDDDWDDDEDEDDDDDDGRLHREAGLLDEDEDNEPETPEDDAKASLRRLAEDAARLSEDAQRLIDEY